MEKKGKVIHTQKALIKTIHQIFLPNVVERSGKRSSLLSNAFDYEPMVKDEGTKATSGQTGRNTNP